MYRYILWSIACFDPASLPDPRSVSDSPVGACLTTSLQLLQGSMWSLFIRTHVCICFMERTMCSFNRWGALHNEIRIWTKKRLIVSFSTLEKLIQVQKLSGRAFLIALLSALIQMAWLHTVISQWLGFHFRMKVLNCCKPKGTMTCIRSIKSCYKSSKGAVSTLISGEPVGDLILIEIFNWA